MEKPTSKKKVLKSYRLRPEIIDALKRGMIKHGYAEETEYLEDVLQLALGLKIESPTKPSVSRKALALAA